MPYFITPDGSYYEGTTVAEGSIEVPQRPGPEYKWTGSWVIDDSYQHVQKLEIMEVARANREILIGRLTWLRTECTEALQVAQVAVNTPEIALQTANINAIKSAINSLVNALEDPRVVAAVNGAAKQAIQLVYAEIVFAFRAAAPVLYGRFKKLDAL